MEGFFGLMPAIVPAVVFGYLLGALPLADRISRRHGVDVFSTGTGLAGATNVFRSVGRTPALLVLVGDMSKGALAVIAARFLGIEGTLVLLPVAAAILGHWYSVFSGFRGGDGLATLGGAALALFPILGAISLAVGMLVQFSAQRMPYSSLMGIVFAYATLVALSLAYVGDNLLVLGTGGLAGLVLAYALNGHRRRRNATRLKGHGEEWDASEEEWEELRDAEGAIEHPGSK